MRNEGHQALQRGSLREVSTVARSEVNYRSTHPIHAVRGGAEPNHMVGPTPRHLLPSSSVLIHPDLLFSVSFSSSLSLLFAGSKLTEDVSRREPATSEEAKLDASRRKPTGSEEAKINAWARRLQRWAIAAQTKAAATALRWSAMPVSTAATS